MQLVNNNISPLPFYDDLALQHHRKDYAFGQICPVMTYRNMLLPFQAVLSSGTGINWARLYDFNTGGYTDITASMEENGLAVTAYTEFSVLKYPGTLPVVEIKLEGLYYLAISVTGLGTVYSDLFSVNNNVDDFLLIKYSNSYNFELKGGMVDFSDNFEFKCYLPTQIGRPEYEFEEETTDRMGYSFIESQVSKKIYKFTFLAPEFLCDALRIVRLCDTKTIYSKSQTYELTTFSMEPEWEDQGDLASVECEFETDTVIANIGGYEPELLGGDYLKADYDNDYYIGDDASTIIAISLYASTAVAGLITATASSNVKSDLTITVNYTHTGGSGAASIIMGQGSVTASTQTGDSSVSITSASVTKGDADTTTYTITY